MSFRYFCVPKSRAEIVKGRLLKMKVRFGGEEQGYSIAGVADELGGVEEAFRRV